MKRALLIAVLSLSFVSAEAKDACFASNESLVLTPTGAVTLDGLILHRSSATGRFTDDAGLDFDLNQSTLAVVPVPGGCNVDATSVTLVTANPFDGPDAGAMTLTAVKP